VGVAGAPVTDWRLYDTGYSERYMGLLDQNGKGYEATDLTKHAKNLRGKLLLLHSLMDENVHFQNSAHLIDALVAADKTFDLFVFPGERHGFREPAARRYALRRTVDYLAEHL
jgi:dipeptidyl-peptidase-4